MDSPLSKRSLKGVTEGNPSRCSFPWSQSWELHAALRVPVFQELIRNRESLRNGTQRKKTLDPFKLNIPDNPVQRTQLHSLVQGDPTSQGNQACAPQLLSPEPALCNGEATARRNPRTQTKTSAAEYIFMLYGSAGWSQDCREKYQ